jgi:hypothetical protein
MLDNSTEKEVAILHAARKLFNAMVNRSMLSFNVNYDELSVQPSSSESAALFNILLLDFISELTGVFPQDIKHTMLSALVEITKKPSFNKENTVTELKKSLNEFQSWLNHEATFDGMSLQSIDKELSLTMTRKKFVKICGNIAKHNTFRLTRTAKDILNILKRNEPSLTHENAILALEDFYNYFHGNIFLYHLTRISEMLNNISWGIQTYLEPEYRRSYIIDTERSALDKHTVYSFDYPPEIKSELGKSYYWYLMNEVRAKPHIPKFKAHIIWLQRY